MVHTQCSALQLLKLYILNFQVCYKYYSLLALLNKNFMVLNFFLVSPIYTFHHSQLFSVGFEVFTHPTLRREVIDALEFCQSLGKRSNIRLHYK